MISHAALWQLLRRNGRRQQNRLGVIFPRQGRLVATSALPSHSGRSCCAAEPFCLVPGPDLSMRSIICELKRPYSPRCPMSSMFRASVFTHRVGERVTQGVNQVFEHGSLAPGDQHVGRHARHKALQQLWPET